MADNPALIVGAGAAGLAAARMLSRAGVSCLILEARRRVGGRIHTLYDPLSPVPVDLGAEFVHGKPPQIWREIDGAPLTAVELNAEMWRSRDGKLESADEFFGEAEEPFGGMADAPEQSFQQYIDGAHTSADTKRWSTRYVKGFHAARPELVSIKALAQTERVSQETDGDRSFRLVRGYASLVERLLAGMDPEKARIRLGAVVERIAWKRGEATVTARLAGRAYELKARRAIINAPLGVLQQGAIRFDPVPDTLRNACGFLAAGHAIRMVFRFRRPVWEDRSELRNAGFIFSGEEWMPTWWTALPARAPVITAWTGGPAAEAHAHETADEWAVRAIASLSHILSIPEEKLAAELDCWHVHNWATDPFSCGAYSYVKVGGLDAQRRLSEPVEDTLYFAGEANAGGAVGTVHGAIASGERAARAIVEE